MPSELGIIPMVSSRSNELLTGFTPWSIFIPAVFLARSNSTSQWSPILNSTGQEILLKMGRNSWIYSLVELGIIPVNLLPFLAIFLAWSNSTGQEILLKMGRNSWIYSLVELGIIPVNLLPFLAIFHARSNSTGQEILLKMGRNSWIYSQFE